MNIEFILVEVLMMLVLDTEVGAKDLSFGFKAARGFLDGVRTSYLIFSYLVELRILWMKHTLTLCLLDKTIWLSF